MPFVPWGDIKYGAIKMVGLSPRKTKPVEDKITLELIRNVEMSARGRAYIDNEGNFTYKSRHARNA
jgi:hypothetical protein